MNVNLGDTFDKFIADLIKGGLYQSQSEVVREGLRLLKEREEIRLARLSHLRSELDQGIKDLDNGSFRTYDDESLKKAFKESAVQGRKKVTRNKVRPG